MFIISRKGGVHLVHNNFVYRSNLKRQGRDLNKIYWECIYNRSTKCRGRLKSIGDQLIVTNGTVQKRHNFVAKSRIDSRARPRICGYRAGINVSIIVTVEHNHVEDVARVESAQQTGSLIFKRISLIGVRAEKNLDYSYVNVMEYKNDSNIVSETII